MYLLETSQKSKSLTFRRQPIMLTRHDYRLFALLRAGVSSLKSKRELALENLALRQQLAVYKRKAKRPKLTNADRFFWMALMRWWPKWRDSLIIVKPETVISWHRNGFRLFLGVEEPSPGRKTKNRCRSASSGPANG